MPTTTDVVITKRVRQQSATAVSVCSNVLIHFREWVGQTRRQICDEGTGDLAGSEPVLG